MRCFLSRPMQLSRFSAELLVPYGTAVSPASFLPFFRKEKKLESSTNHVYVTSSLHRRLLLMEVSGLEPLTSCLQSRRSTN